MSWEDLFVSPDGTHHVRQGEPAYGERFDQVWTFHAPGLAPVRVGAEAWHVRPDGSPAYDRRFRATYGYYEGLAAVVSPEGWHHIDAVGHDVCEARWVWCGNFQGGRCTVRAENGAYFHITGSGAPVYAARWRYAGDYREGAAVVQGDDGRSTHIDPDGRPLHDFWFEDLDAFHKALARARDARGWMHIGRSGEPIYERRFAAVEPFYNGQARVERFDGGREVIDETGATVLELRAAKR